MNGKNSEDYIDKLVSSDSVRYRPNHQKYVLEIYKVYMQTIERVSDRRQRANSFFLSINTAIIALIGYVQSVGGVDAASTINLFVPPAGIFICYTWYRVLRSYRGLNAGKFEVILALEDLLPVCPFRVEWVALGEGRNPKRYKPIGKLEAIVPWIFLIIHLTVIAVAVYKKAFT